MPLLNTHSAVWNESVFLVDCRAVAACHSIDRTDNLLIIKSMGSIMGYIISYPLRIHAAAPYDDTMLRTVIVKSGVFATPTNLLITVNDKCN